MNATPYNIRIVVTGIRQLRNTPSGNPVYQIKDATGLGYITDRDSQAGVDAGNLKPGQLANLTIGTNGAVIKIAAIPLINLNIKGV